MLWLCSCTWGCWATLLRRSPSWPHTTARNTLSETSSPRGVATIHSLVDPVRWAALFLYIFKKFISSEGFHFSDNLLKSWRVYPLHFCETFLAKTFVSMTDMHAFIQHMVCCGLPLVLTVLYTCIAVCIHVCILFRECYMKYCILPGYNCGQVSGSAEWLHHLVIGQNKGCRTSQVIIKYVLKDEARYWVNAFLKTTLHRFVTSIKQIFQCLGYNGKWSLLYSHT